MNEFLRTSSILAGHEYSFQDTTTIFHRRPTRSSAIKANGISEAVNTARSKVTKNSIESARTP